MESKEWNVQSGGQYYNVKYEKRKIYVNGEKIKKKNVKGNILEQGYNVPLGDEAAVLYVPERIKNEPVLTLNGNNVLTNTVYEPAKMPKWGYVFVALYLLNIIILVGGAIGTGLAVIFCGLSFRVIADKQGKTSNKVLMCVGLYLADVVASFMIIFLLSGFLG